MLQGVTDGYKGLRGLQGFTRDYRGLQGVQGVTRCYRGLQGITGGYTFSRSIFDKHKNIKKTSTFLPK